MQTSPYPVSITSFTAAREVTSSSGLNTCFYHIENWHSQNSPFKLFLSFSGCQLLYNASKKISSAPAVSGAISQVEQQHITLLSHACRMWGGATEIQQCFWETMHFIIRCKTFGGKRAWKSGSCVASDWKEDPKRVPKLEDASRVRLAGPAPALPVVLSQEPTWSEEPPLPGSRPFISARCNPEMTVPPRWKKDCLDSLLLSK